MVGAATGCSSSQLSIKTSLRELFAKHFSNSIPYVGNHSQSASKRCVIAIKYRHRQEYPGGSIAQAAAWPAPDRYPYWHASHSS
jgi:hypothetical protein